MNTRTITLYINEEYVKGDGIVAGAAGSHNDVLLELNFSSMWEGLVKKITWTDAKGENPVTTILTTNFLIPGKTDVYLVPIPKEPKAIEGTMTMAIKGMTVEGQKVTRATLSATAKFTIMPSDYNEACDFGGDVTASQSEQLQAQIDAIKGDIVNAGNSAREAAASATKAESYAVGGTASRVGEDTDNAKYYAEQAGKSEVRAKGFASEAEASKTGAAEEYGKAKGEAEKAAAKAIEADNSAISAKDSETKAKTSEINAKASEKASEGFKNDAVNEASKAKQEASNASQSAVKASTSANKASTSESNAKLYEEGANKAKTDAEGEVVKAANEVILAKQEVTKAQKAVSDATLEVAKAEAEAVTSKSWAVGGTGSREGEDVNNAKYWAGKASEAVGGSVVSFNGRKGVVIPQAGDYTAEQVGADAKGTAQSLVNGAKSLVVTITKTSLGTYHADATEAEIEAAERAGRLVVAKYDDVDTNTGEQIYYLQNFRSDGARFYRPVIETDTVYRIIATVDYAGDVTFKKVEFAKVSDENFTTVLKNKLEGLNNYDDKAVKQDIENLKTGKADKTEVTDALKLKADTTTVKTDLDRKANKLLSFTAKLTANGWSGSAPFTQTVNVSGMVADGQPFHDLASHADKTVNKEFAKLTNLETQAGKIVATCLEKKPTVDLDIVIKVVF